MKQGLGGKVLTAILLAAVAGMLAPSPTMALPLTASGSPADPVSAQMSLLHRVLIYAKEGSRRLVDGRWNLSQSKAKLGLAFSAEETKQLMACTGRIICHNRGREVFGSASSVLRPDLLVTAKHVFSEGRKRPVPYESCSFRSFLHRNLAIPVAIEKDQRKGYFLNNEDFIVVRLKRPLKDCDGFAISDDAFLAEGEPIFSATGYQRRSLNRLSTREPVIAKGTIRSVSTGFFGGPPFYYGEIDLDEGGSGGAIFALKDGRPVTDNEGRLVLRGILVAVGPRGKNGKPYSEDQNYTIIIGLQDEFRDLAIGKAHGDLVVEHAPCLDDAAPEIAVLSEPVPTLLPETLVPVSGDESCGAGASSANCTKIAKELRKLADEIETLAASSPAKRKLQFKLRNDTHCPICFTYNRCNEYGCWDETVRASGKSTLFAGVSKQAPKIRDPQFCASGPLLAAWRPPLPPKRPVVPPPLPLRKILPEVAEAVFSAAKAKAAREGVWALTAEDIRGLSLDQITELRGY